MQFERVENPGLDAIYRVTFEGDEVDAVTAVGKEVIALRYENSEGERITDDIRALAVIKRSKDEAKTPISISINDPHAVLEALDLFTANTRDAIMKMSNSTGTPDFLDPVPALRDSYGQTASKLHKNLELHLDQSQPRLDPACGEEIAEQAQEFLRQNRNR